LRAIGVVDADAFELRGNGVDRRRSNVGDLFCLRRLRETNITLKRREHGSGVRANPTPGS
jgi:hypothetical protein